MNAKKTAAALAAAVAFSLSATSPTNAVTKNQGIEETGPGPASLKQCMARNSNMFNFIATRALMPRPSMDVARLYRPSTGSMSDGVISSEMVPNSITLESGGRYFEFRADGREGMSAKKRLESMCQSDPSLNLPAIYQAMIMQDIEKKKSLIDNATRKRLKAKDTQRTPTYP